MLFIFWSTWISRLSVYFMVFGFTAVEIGVGVASPALGIREVDGSCTDAPMSTVDSFAFDCSSSSIFDEAFRGIDREVRRLCNSW